MGSCHSEGARLLAQAKDMEYALAAENGTLGKARAPCQPCMKHASARHKLSFIPPDAMLPAVRLHAHYAWQLWASWQKIAYTNKQVCMAA